jgi:hypothetical protein
MSELLADDTVTETNLMQFLGVIEQRANEIMQRLARLRRGDGALDSSSVGAGAGVAARPASVPLRDDRDGSPAPGSLGQTLVSLLSHGPSTQHGVENTVSVDPPKIDDYSTVRGLGRCAPLCSALLCSALLCSALLSSDMVAMRCAGRGRR